MASFQIPIQSDVSLYLVTLKRKKERKKFFVKRVDKRIAIFRGLDKFHNLILEDSSDAYQVRIQNLLKHLTWGVLQN